MGAKVRQAWGPRLWAGDKRTNQQRSKHLTCIRSLFVPAALGERAVRAAFFYFHDGSAYGFGKHRVMLFSSIDRKKLTDRRDRKADWPLKFICNFIIIQTMRSNSNMIVLHDSSGCWIDVCV